MRFIASGTLQHKEITTRKASRAGSCAPLRPRLFPSSRGLPFPRRRGGWRGARSSKCSSLSGAGPPPQGGPLPVELEVLLIRRVDRRLLVSGLFLAELGRLQEGWKPPRGGSGKRRKEVGKGERPPGQGPADPGNEEQEGGGSPQTPGGWQHLCPWAWGPPRPGKGHLPVLSAPRH